MWRVPAVWPQEQKEVPPVQPFLLPDTVRTAPERPQLELPEVLVYGRDVSLRLPGQKLAVQQPPRVGLPSREAPHSDQALVAQTREELFVSNKPAGRSLLVRLEGGSYWTGAVEGLYRQSQRRLNYGADMSFRRSDGAVDNGHYAILGLGGHITYALSGGGTVQGRLKLTQASYGLAGATLPDTTMPLKAERHATVATFGTRAELGVGRSGQMTFAYEYCSLACSDDTLTTRFSRLSDGLQRFEATGAVRVGSTDLLARITYLREGHRSQGDGERQWNSLAEAECGLGRDLFRRGRAYVGLGLHSFSGSMAKRQSTLAATARLWAAVTPRLGWMLEMRRGYDYRTLVDRSAENPYYAARLGLFPVRTTFAFSTGAEWQVAPNLLLELRVGRAWLKEQWYWQRDPATGLFTTGVVPKLGLNHGSFALRYAPNEQLNIEARYSLWSDSFHLEQWPHASDVPYLAHRRLPVTVSYRLGNRTRIECTGDVVSSRTAEMGSQVKLSPYALLGCVVSHQVSRRLVLFVQGENLANRAYERWQGYREMGLMVLAGGFATW